MHSKNYSSIIEFERNDRSINIYDQVNKFIQDATLIFTQDTENFSYDEKKITSMEELINFKNKINIKPPKEIKVPNEFQEKCPKLEFFRNIISNLEVIYEYMEALRTKGSNLPILIGIKIEYPEIKYSLDNKNTDFENIREYLFQAKTDYITQLDSIYKKKVFLRFLSGKQFRSIMKHLESYYKIEDILKFILNKTDNKEDYKEGEKANPRKTDDYVQNYTIYSESSFDNISRYLTSLFEKNGTSLQKLYETMLIKEKNKYKGIYLHKCINESMEEFILNIFWNIIGQLPIAQNILICSKETSQEEMQAFFHRAILCDYNTLFVVEINDSFSDFQQKIMYTYIDTLLTYKNEKYKENVNKKNVDNANTKEYLNSCIIFIYEQNNEEEISFLNEIKRYDIEEIGYKFLNKKEEEQDKDDLNNKSLLFSFDNKLFENIRVITSDICGLGKSHKIKKMIEKDDKKYYHFSLGGILSKTVIFQKISTLFEKIKKENENNCNNVAIHLDLTESKDTSIINEFLLSFLITKFYTNIDNIIYIPKDIDIYIEIQNCFDNYLSKLGILNVFPKENISLENIPKLDLSKNVINAFEMMININSKDEKEVNDEIEKFIKTYIGNDKCSYHQIIIFIKLFISQYSKYNSKCTSKITFIEGNKDIPETFIKEFAECTKYFINGKLSKLLTVKNEDKEEKDYIDLLSDIYLYDLKVMQFYIPLIFLNKEKKTIHKLILSNYEKHQSSKQYLEKMKEILDLPNEVENDVGNKKSLLSILNYKTDDYVITNDNFIKMFLLIYRIKANIPVIIMGETGCGKTALITKLNQILNNGEITLKTINIHPWITDEDIYNFMKVTNEEAKKNKENEIWVFFDTINTCYSLSLITEIFINRTYNGEQLSENIRLIGACNPYRKRKGHTEKCGLSRDDDNESELIYHVQPLPQSLLYYVFCFGSINEEDEKKYISNIIEKLFTKNEKYLHEATRDAIFESHKFLRETFDPSVVSLRDISRFLKCVEFFQNYFTIKKEYQNEIYQNEYEKKKDKESKIKLYKIKSIICSIYLCYYIRLIYYDKRCNFNNRLREILLNLVNIGEKVDDIEKGCELVEQIKFKELQNDLKDEYIYQFSDFLKIEEDFLLEQIELDKSIGINNLLRENTFSVFLSVITKIPLIIVGKPGTGKSLSAQLIYKSMRGINSKNKFFQKYPQIIQTYFQGSESTKPQDIEELFEIAGNKLQFYKDNKENNKLPISMILFDELGIAEKSENNCFEVLNNKLEYTGKAEGISFIGISNYSLDAAKVNRALYLSVPNLEDRLDNLIETSKSIVKNISYDLSNNYIFEILARAYFGYKNKLRFIKELTALKHFDSKNKESKKSINVKNMCFCEIKNIRDFKKLLKKEKKIKVDFHGNRDLYNIIKGIAKEIERLDGNGLDPNRVVLIIEKYIERNFGGIDYEIDIDLDLKLTDIEHRIKLVEEIVKEFNMEKSSRNKSNKKIEKEIIKVSSVFLFKKIYNFVCEMIESEDSLKISNNNINRYDLNKCINDNINDINSRYLLLEIKPSLTSLIYECIKIHNPLKLIDFYEGSPFVDDLNNEYRFKKINEIGADAKTDKLIILQNLNQIHPFLYDLYNQTYIIKDERKFARICMDNCIEELIPVNDLFKIIIFVDRTFMNQADIEFLKKFEKQKITFGKLLDYEQKRLANLIIDEISFKYNIEKYQRQINYRLRDLLINCGKEEIKGLIYYYSVMDRNNGKNIDDYKLKDKIYNQISNILPQDIIWILPDDNIIKKKYNENKKYYNLKEYINDEENKKYKISIIYTFNNISNNIDSINNEMEFMVSEIRAENQLNNIINEIKNQNEHNKHEKNYNIVIHFEQNNLPKIQFISNLIMNNFKKDKYNYIFIIHLKRNFGNIKDRIYSIPDINPDINQIFIDNLNAKDIKLNDLLNKKIKEIIDNDKLVVLEKEFKRTLTSFIYNEQNEIRYILSSFVTENNLTNEDNYIDEIKKNAEKIIVEFKELINNDNDLDIDYKSFIDKTFKMNYIGRNSIDFISCSLDFIKEHLFSKYLKHILSNNISNLMRK